MRPFLPGVVSLRGTKWLYQAAEVAATYDPGMMRFVARDPAWEGELRMELVPLAPGNGYAIRVTTTKPVEFAFAFGGFLCMPDKDVYQGNTEFSKGIVAELYGNATVSFIDEKVAVAMLHEIVGTHGKPISKGLNVALLTDRRDARIAARGPGGNLVGRSARTAPRQGAGPGASDRAEDRRSDESARRGPRGGQD